MASKPVIRLDGADYDLVIPDDMTLGEQRAFERIADAGVDRLDDLGDDFRVTLVVAWMAVSIQRAQPQRPMEQIVARLDELKPAELQDAWAKVEQSPPATSGPPPAPGENETSSDAPSTTASDATRGNGNPNGSGSPGSDTGSLSVPATSQV